MYLKASIHEGFHQSISRESNLLLAFLESLLSRELNLLTRQDRKAIIAILFKKDAPGLCFRNKAVIQDRWRSTAFPMT